MSTGAETGAGREAWRKSAEVALGDAAPKPPQLLLRLPEVAVDAEDTEKALSRLRRGGGFDWGRSGSRGRGSEAGGRRK
jgi:hypothetical protein